MLRSYLVPRLQRPQVIQPAVLKQFQILAPDFFGLFEIETTGKPSAVRPHPPPSLKIHPIFHLCLFNPVWSPPTILRPLGGFAPQKFSPELGLTSSEDLSTPTPPPLKPSLETPFCVRSWILIQTSALCPRLHLGPTCNKCQGQTGCAIFYNLKQSLSKAFSCLQSPQNCHKFIKLGSSSVKCSGDIFTWSYPRSIDVHNRNPTNHTLLGFKWSAFLTHTQTRTHTKSMCTPWMVEFLNFH